MGQSGLAEDPLEKIQPVISHNPLNQSLPEGLGEKSNLVGSAISNKCPCPLQEAKGSPEYDFPSPGETERDPSVFLQGWAL